jgi:hypothetical protein
VINQTVHDELVIAATPDGGFTPVAYHRNVPNRDHVSAGTPRRRLVAVPSPSAPIAPRALGSQPTPSAAMTTDKGQREHIRVLAAKCGYLPPRNLEEATYPPEWLPELHNTRRFNDA